MRIPSQRTQKEIEIRKSRFIAIADAAGSREEVKGAVAEQWSLHPDASHVVWAFRTGERGDVFGMSDDGEPAGTAGRPVLEVIRGSGISDIVVMVVRYFGGTKLGTGGLVKAYTEASQRVISSLPSEKRISRLPFRLSLSYSTYQRVRELLGSVGTFVQEESFTSEITLSGTLPSSRREEIEGKIADITSGTSSLIITGDAHYGPAD